MSDDKPIKVSIEQVELADWQKWLIVFMIGMSLFSWLIFAMM